jgi:hypothetical protein
VPCRGEHDSRNAEADAQLSAARLIPIGLEKTTSALPAVAGCAGQNVLSTLLAEQAQRALGLPHTFIPVRER